MSRQTFDYLCDILHEEIGTVNTHYRDAIPTPTKVGVALLRLSQGIRFMQLGDIFGIGESTACMICDIVS